MKQPKKLTRNQKELLAKSKLNWREWMLLREDQRFYTFIHKGNGRRKILVKEG